MAVATDNVDGYVLARNSDEYERLRVQARHWDEATRSTLEKIGLGLGGNCLDVGCGPGEVMRLLGERVGAKGSVTGLDSDARLGAEALAALSASGSTQYSFVDADLTKVAIVNGGPFDLVFARLVLIHMPNPVEVLVKLWSWVKPGGTLCIMNYDQRTIGSFPSDIASGRILEIIWDALKRTGKHTTIGAEMPWLFERAGIGVPDGTSYSGQVLSTVDFAERNPRVLVSALRDGILSNRISTVEELAALDQQLEAEATKHSGYVITASMVSTWKCKVV